MRAFDDHVDGGHAGARAGVSSRHDRAGGRQVARRVVEPSDGESARAISEHEAADDPLTAFGAARITVTLRATVKFFVIDPQ
ncbi:MAG: hypothetical protein ACXWYB_12970 [Aeromicrobium sp.]